MSRKTRVLSVPAATILRRFLESPADELHGFRIIKETSIRSSTLYPALRLLADERGFLKWRWEDTGQRTNYLPPRRLYRLNGTPQSIAAARAALAEHDEHQRQASSRR